jgi:hypothetical protein
MMRYLYRLLLHLSCQQNDVTFNIDALLLDVGQEY